MIVGTIALLAILLGGGGASPAVLMPDDFQQRLEQAITEPARSERAVAEWKALQKDLEGFTKDLKGLRERVYKADDALGTGAAQIESMLAGFDPARKASQERTFDRLFAIRGAMTREEWGKLFKEPAGAGTK